MKNNTGPSADLKKYGAEFAGTFLLVFVAAGAVMVTASFSQMTGALLGGLASGVALGLAIWFFAGISGGHVNPALSLWLALTGVLPLRLLPGYVICQLAGSAAAGLVLFSLLEETGTMGANLPNLTLGIRPWSAFGIEALLSFVMMVVILLIPRAPKSVAVWAPALIGLTVGIEVMLFGGVAGAAMNPARAFGPYVFHGDWEHFWIYTLGPILGIGSATLIFFRRKKS